jgi:carboxymethylenebutenolidase
MSGERMTIHTPDGAFGAYVARPSADKAPAVVVIQEIFGVNAVMRAVADWLASAGFLAVCPDLFWRIEPGIDISDQSDAEWKKAFELYNVFDVDAGVKDIAAAIDAIRQDPHGTGKVGAVGFCLGGLLSYLTATRTDVDAAVGYYGVGIDKYVAEAEKLAQPLLLHVAEADQFVPPPAQAVIKDALAMHSGVELFSYPGRDHAFARVGGQHYDAADAKLANDRTLAFLKKALG